MLFTKNLFDEKEELLSKLYLDLKNISYSTRGVDKDIQIFKDRATWIFEALFTDSQKLVKEINDVDFQPLKCRFEDKDQEMFYKNRAFEDGLREANDILEYAKEKLKFARMVSETSNRLKSEKIMRENDSDSETIKMANFTTENKKVFIVHGHDDSLKTEVARFIERQGLEALILHEQASRGNTIIEKIEANSDVGFAIIIYTPCDFGRASSIQEELPRARQNVIFEHGYFVAKLGRSNVVALHKGNVEIPNDLSGVVYTLYDDYGAWKLKVARELKESGYKIDFERI